MSGADPRTAPSGLHVQRALHLKTFPAFAELPLETLAVLAEPCERRSFTPGEPLLCPDAPAPSLHFILSGAVDVLDGDQVLRHMSGREAVGGLAVLTGDPAHAVATAATETLALDREVLLEVFEDHPEIRSAVLRALARTLLNVLARSVNPPPRLPLAPADGVQVDLPLPEAGHPRAGLELGPLLWLSQALRFEGATITATADLAREARAVHLVAGQRLWNAGDPADAAWLPTTGSLTTTAPSGARQSVGPGAILGALEALAGRPRAAAAAAAEDTIALVFSPDALLDTGEDHPGFALGLIRALARAIQAAS